MDPSAAEIATMLTTVDAVDEAHTWLGMGSETVLAIRTAAGHYKRPREVVMMPLAPWDDPLA